MIKILIKKFIPKFVLSWYHYSLAILAKWFYGNPSGKMIVVGVTGTAGKSSTSYFIAQILENAGLKVGMTTTTLFKIADKEWLNNKKMTMLGRFQTQKLLKQMLKAGCTVAIIETSSEGIKQYRHIGIDYNMLVLTNLYPEHIEAHGSFENYKKTKGKLFKHLGKKTIIINTDDKHADYFLNFPAKKKIKYNIKDWDNNWQMNLLGEYNKYNVLAAMTVAKELKIEPKIDNLKPLPGRLEFIENNLGINIIVDYSFEPKALEKLYQTIADIKYNKLIHVLGSTGGGRDKARRPILGKMANEKADIVIITNEDPYDENPQEIIDQVASQVEKNKLYKILDRRAAIKKALELADKRDLVLITGKGAEQAMCVENGKMIPWDDRTVVREELVKLS
ncbi:hypothetical protein A3H03_02960 [Candidatus Kuenenbacteria bacterium RIFCSPLOWO2_12_FULL_42_13]|uniref:UDP-N-acetylmuramoyl-L-alanyl-D-glutamate--2, 6-diaminopimelate ligase n=5 Tax=Candidatus Kueneniibacteriota TaxID=1752740 RepID=A0A1F6G0H5_9BACT|nr:MAG: hypothetical protein A3C68_01895 [Candidatus Kuenenbacteria bacterium RIFCSPHIGHO2_02_FULL_42_29]OGG91128.1 MAG: hypothetical protein A3H55_02210 [Candidatus Kuenenbacteria bacterium RIFCSPLOWO2_02_FULL_42_16]OGG91627.1 MAG: hypothetical protein A3H03_02960 [Candidatus Kuenenbacteria bacterium RIFCSPLOWO2_12_FULL_42_13]OGG98647.1 MAG: hypothetical protein A3E04_01335 [Candidatus Kuenenbacteria bacterium RIFCSPHIGHO2_12_FULL_42_14]